MWHRFSTCAELASASHRLETCATSHSHVSEAMKTEIVQTDPETGAQVDASPELRSRVEDAAHLLEAEFGDLDSVKITVARCSALTS